MKVSIHTSSSIIHNLGEQESMRNVLVELSVDWFPPFKDDANTSFGLIAAVPIGLETCMKSKSEHLWVLGILDGPREPKHLSVLMETLIARFTKMATEGELPLDPLRD